MLTCGLFSGCGERELLFVVVHGLLIAVTSLLVEPGLDSTGSVAVPLGLSCSAAHGICPDQGSNLPRRLHWQADSSPLSHQGSSISVFFLHLPLGPERISENLCEVRSLPTQQSQGAAPGTLPARAGPSLTFQAWLAFRPLTPDSGV